MKYSWVILTLLCLAATGSIASAAKKHKDKKCTVEEIEVKNFGKINDHLYRGGQPDEDEYEQLAALGMKTVIDLRDDAKDRAHLWAQKAGMRYINLPIVPKHQPTIEESMRFLSLVNDQANWPVFVHCAGGRHRTGVMIAVYRMEMNNWDVKMAYDEMKDFKFYSSGGYGEMKEYVYDYYRKLTERRSLATPTRADQ